MSLASLKKYAAVNPYTYNGNQLPVVWIGGQQHTAEQVLADGRAIIGGRAYHTDQLPGNTPQTNGNSYVAGGPQGPVAQAQQSINTPSENTPARVLTPTTVPPTQGNDLAALQRRDAEITSRREALWHAKNNPDFYDNAPNHPKRVYWDEDEYDNLRREQVGLREKLNARKQIASADEKLNALNDRSYNEALSQQYRKDIEEVDSHYNKNKIRNWGNKAFEAVGDVLLGPIINQDKNQRIRKQVAEGISEVDGSGYEWDALTGEYVRKGDTKIKRFTGWVGNGLRSLNPWETKAEEEARDKAIGEERHKGDLFRKRYKDITYNNGVRTSAAGDAARSAAHAVTTVGTAGIGGAATTAGKVGLGATTAGTGVASAIGGRGPEDGLNTGNLNIQNSRPGGYIPQPNRNQYLAKNYNTEGVFNYR